MPVIAQVLAGIAAALHVVIFGMESLWWSRPQVWKRFGLTSQADADVARPLAFNQGFYNLFLAIGIAVGLVVGGVAGHAIVVFCCVSIVGAALVLASTGPKYLRPAIVQGVTPLLALITAAIF
ncbi:DUF1304 domain-containing protein [Rhodococcus sp. NPDC059234]|uniref:DUF1304 domain-containing protein n=1 Tax=Rhodococcus sp. NPDC059234 TaxID=3346781 RepID=UPI00366CF8E0